MPTPEARQQAELRRRIARIRRRLDGRLRAARNPLEELGVSKGRLAWLAGELAAMGLAWGLSQRRPHQVSDWLGALLQRMWPTSTGKRSAPSSEGHPPDVR